jgi:hypothetical protein
MVDSRILVTLLREDLQHTKYLPVNLVSDPITRIRSNYLIIRKLAYMLDGAQNCGRLCVLGTVFG